ncbi:hypothetical protein [Anaeromyxobacter sp. Fw109-5]|uniref:LIC_10190 family membrane protein n=1 Tax=Anaeromyxobacter sp. (strain Fw109-5) TaxID=404589 RepID=UPI00059BAFDD|nr:hypothetical protein [Anaeromyxobacter sp. Fw109-5]
MLPTLLALTLWTPALLGLGSVFTSRIDADLRPAVSGSLGLAILAAAGMALNPWTPIGSIWPTVAFATGWALVIARRRVFLPSAAAPIVWYVSAVAVACAALTQFSSAGGKGYDAGLYHLQVLEWIRHHRQPPGLASLYGPFGYGVSWFVVAAMLEIPGLTGKSPFVLNGLAVLFAAWAALAGLARLSREGSKTFGDGLLAATAIPACLALESLAFPGYDDPLTLVAFLALALWALAIESDDGLRPWRTVAAILLSVFAATMKLSAVPLVVGAAAGTVLLARGLRRPHVIAAVGGAMALLVPYTVRGIIASGCVAYPAYPTCLSSLPWTVTRQNAEGVTAAAVNFARAPPLEQAGFLTPIARVVPYLAEAGRLPLFALLALTLGASAVVLGTEGLRSAVARGSVRFVGGVAAAGVVFWLATAPNPRFGVTYLLPLTVLPLAVALAAEDRRARRARKALALLCALFTTAAAGWTLRHLTWNETALVRWPAYPESHVEPRVTASGLEVNVPVEGMQCWTAPPPCTPTYDPNLAWEGMFISRPNP